MSNDKPTKSPQGGRQGWLCAYAQGLKTGTKKGWLESLRLWSIPQEEAQDVTKKTYLNAADGPMVWLGEQIIKRMEKAGYPSRIFIAYRSADQQNKEFAEGDSKARAYQSPHQFYEAVDIIHKTRAWNVSQDYWDTLASIVRVVEREYNIDLVHGYDWGWDSAHIEIALWRQVPKRQLAKVGYHYPPSPWEREQRFKELLPAVYKSQHRD